jgi:hypothetical protein
MDDLTKVYNNLLELLFKIVQLAKTQPDLASKNLQIPMWIEQQKNYMPEVFGSMAKFSSHYKMLNNPNLSAKDNESNKNILQKLSADIIKYTESYLAVPKISDADKVFCKDLIQELKGIDNILKKRPPPPSNDANNNPDNTNSPSTPRPKGPKPGG